MRRFAALLLVTILSACGGGGGSAPPPGPTSTPLPPPPINPPVSSTVLTGEENFVNGDMTWYTSGTSTWSNHAGDPAGAPNGTSPVDGSTCSNVHEGTQYPAGKFSQHIFVGIYFNGVEQALPQAVGMVNPEPPTTPAPPDFPAGHPLLTDPVELAQCWYNVHSHDYSGLVHIEDTSLAQSNTTMPAYATLQTLIDVWGAQLTAIGLTAGSNTLSGRMILYVGTPSGKLNGNDLVNSYTLFTGSPASLSFTKHVAIWIVIGALPAAFPQVQIVQTN